MRKPQDSDIFGTKKLRIAPRIENDQKIDPYATFKAKMQEQYNTYANKVNPVKTFTKYVQLGTKVNQQAQFDQNYHHLRKEAEMNSTIFNDPSENYFSQSRMTNRKRLTQRNVPRHANQNEDENNYNFGRKETLTRQIDNLPQNKVDFKGNCSTIFGYDQKQERNQVKNHIQKLIPHQMQWDQHDSIKYQGQNPYDTEQKLAQSKFFDGQIPKDIITKVEDLKINDVQKQNNSKEINMKKKQESSKKNAQNSNYDGIQTYQKDLPNVVRLIQQRLCHLTFRNMREEHQDYRKVKDGKQQQIGQGKTQNQKQEQSDFLINACKNFLIWQIHIIKYLDSNEQCQNFKFIHFQERSLFKFISHKLDYFNPYQTYKIQIQRNNHILKTKFPKANPIKIRQLLEEMDNDIYMVIEILQQESDQPYPTMNMEKNVAKLRKEEENRIFKIAISRINKKLMQREIELQKQKYDKQSLLKQNYALKYNNQLLQEEQDYNLYKTF